MRFFGYWVAAVLVAGPVWAQAIVEYGLSVGRAGVTGVNTKGVFDKAGAALGKAAGSVQVAAGNSTAAGRQQEAARNRELLAAQAGESAASVEVTALEGMVISVNYRAVGWGKASLKLPPGKHRIRAAGPGYVTWEEEVELKEKEVRSLTARVERAASTANVIQIHSVERPAKPQTAQP